MLVLFIVTINVCGGCLSVSFHCEILCLFKESCIKCFIHQKPNQRQRLHIRSPIDCAPVTFQLNVTMPTCAVPVK